MANVNDILFLPVKPKWAGVIMSGDKTLELRKRLPLKGYGKRCIIYASSPRCEVIGACTAVAGKRFRNDVTIGNLAQACVTVREFDAYFDDDFWNRFEDPDDKRWYGIELADPTQFHRAIPLESLRNVWGIEPPQQWRYISGQTFDELVNAGRRQ